MLSRQDVKLGGLQASCYTSQGGRKYMEDCFNVANDFSLRGYGEYSFFGVFDGHGGAEASIFARDCLKRFIVQQKLFWSDNDDDVLRAIRQGFIATHYAMWRAQDKWPKTSKGFPSTSGTTASIVFFKNNKFYIGHVGDSGIALGYQEDGEKNWRALQLTRDHKPECNIEKARIINAGGKVISKSGVPRIVWNRPRVGHKGPVRRSTPIDEIPFLAVARSLGDLWSYNSSLNKFVVSPDPDVHVLPFDRETFRCLVFGTDGLWNVVSCQDAVSDIKTATENLNLIMPEHKYSISQYLLEGALLRWEKIKMRADNICVLVVTLDSEDDGRNSRTKRRSSLNVKETGHNMNVANHHHHHHHSSHHDTMWNDNFECSTSSMIHNLIGFDNPDEDISYMDSFAESYNSLYENSLYNMADESVIRHQATNYEELNYTNETYSLTKLQTRSEQINSLMEEYDNSRMSCDQYSSILNSLETNLPLSESIIKSHHINYEIHHHQQHLHHPGDLNDSIQINEITSSSIIPMMNGGGDEFINHNSDSDSCNNVLLENNLAECPNDNNLANNSSNVIINNDKVKKSSHVSDHKPAAVIEHNLRTRRQKLVSLYKLGPPVTRSKDLLFKKKLLINCISTNVKKINLKKKNLKRKKLIKTTTTTTVQSVIPSKIQNINNSNIQIDLSSTDRNSSNSIVNMTSSSGSRIGSRHRNCKYFKAKKSPKMHHHLVHHQNR